MGASRETQNLFFYIKNKKWRKVYYLIKNFDKTTYDDTFGPIFCKILGHKPFKTYEGEWGCNRCNKYINYNPRKEKLKKLNKISK